MKSAEEIMEILEAYDLTESFRDAGKLVGVSHNTVARYVRARREGRLSAAPARRAMLVDEYLPKIEEWMDRSQGKIRGDVIHAKLQAMGYQGSERTTRRAVHRVRRAYRLGHTRVHRPWVTEPGLWLQYDFGDGPVVQGQRTVLFCAWLAWSRFRVVLPLLDKTFASVFAALDATFRILGGAPTYVLTDNEKTVTTEHIAGIAVRNGHMVEFSRHYGVTVHTCVPADPASKGGTENTVKIAKADLVPTNANLRPEYASFEELEAACVAFCDKVNSRVHRTTRRVPAEMLTSERHRLHGLPAQPHTIAFGTTRKVPPNTPMVTFEGGQYSVPHTLLGQTVWVRTYGTGADQHVVIVHITEAGAREVARHLRATAGSPQINDAHFPPAPQGVLNRTPKAKSSAEVEFLALGPGAQLWLKEAAAAGTSKIRIKMAQAVSLAKLFTPAGVDWALGHAAVHGRFGEGDLPSILDHHTHGPHSGAHRRAGEERSLTQGTSPWAALGPQTPPALGNSGTGEQVVA